MTAKREHPEGICRKRQLWEPAERKDECAATAASSTPKKIPIPSPASAESIPFFPGQVGMMKRYATLSAVRNAAA